MQLTLENQLTASRNAIRFKEQFISKRLDEIEQARREIAFHKSSIQLIERTINVQ